MSTDNLILPRKGDIVLTRKGHRRLWDGRHWRVLCRISNCTAQRQGSLDNKFGLCKRHFTQLELKISSVNHEQKYKPISEEEQLKISKRRKLNHIIDQLRYFQTISIERDDCSVISPKFEITQQ
jgi:hypothetical protein